MDPPTISIVRTATSPVRHHHGGGGTRPDIWPRAAIKMASSSWGNGRCPFRRLPAEAGAGGTLEVWAVTDHPAASACPDCGTVSGRVHETVLARPRDVRRAGDPTRGR